MAQMVDTKIPSSTDENLLKAFLYGIIEGEYKFYTSDEDTISIWFKVEEEATLFVMRELEEEFSTNFLEEEDSLQQILKNLNNFPPLTTAPQNPYITNPIQPWSPGPTIGGGTTGIDDSFYKHYTVTCDSSSMMNTMMDSENKT